MANLALAALGGVLLYAGNPPVGQGWMGFIAIAPLVAVGRNLVGRSARTAFAHGVLGGLVGFGPLLYWLIPFGFAAFGLLTGVQSLYVGVFVVVVARLGDTPGRGVWTATAWVAIEVIRSSWPLGGFSWGALAYTQADGGLALGAARSIGTVGVSLILASVAVAVEAAARNAVRSWDGARESDIPADAVFTAMRTPLLSMLSVLAVSILISGEAPTPTGVTTSMGVVQGGDTRATSAAGVNRIDSDRIVRVAELMAQETARFADDTPDIVIWPENSLDSDVRTDRGATVAALLEQSLEVVAPSPILGGETAAGPRPATLYNRMSVFTLNSGSVDIGASYDKQRPVPFAEFIPWRSYLEWVPPLQQIPNDVLAGEGPQVIDVQGARIGPIICFENTFPSIAREQVRAGADVLVVSTNNSSFGLTPMSSQHLAFSQVRAVETGRWVVHAGISGISGFVTPEGEVQQQTGRFEPAGIQMAVPLISDMTLATRLGSAPTWLVMLLTLGGITSAVVRGRTTGPPT